MASHSPFFFSAASTNGLPLPPPSLPIAMSFCFNSTPSPSPPPTDHEDTDVDVDVDYTSSSGADETDVSDSEDYAMEFEFDTVQGKLSKLDLCDADMADFDFDSDFATASESDSDSESDHDSDSDSDPVIEPTPLELIADSTDAPNPHIPPHFTSPLYDAWLAARTPNIVFSIRIKPLVTGSTIAAHSTRLWYRDFSTRAEFLDRIVDEYGLLNVGDICGFVVKERRSGVWVEFGADEVSWNGVMERIRNKTADENLTALSSAVRAEMKVLVGGECEYQAGVVIQKGTFVRVVDPDDDPDK